MHVARFWRDTLENPGIIKRRIQAKDEPLGTQCDLSKYQEKPLTPRKRDQLKMTVPQTDTGRLVSKHQGVRENPR